MQLIKLKMDAGIISLTLILTKTVNVVFAIEDLYFIIDNYLISSIEKHHL